MNEQLGRVIVPHCFFQGNNSIALAAAGLYRCFRPEFNRQTRSGVAEPSQNESDSLRLYDCALKILLGKGCRPAKSPERKPAKLTFAVVARDFSRRAK